MAMASLVGRTMTSAKHIAKAVSLAKGMALCKIKSLAKLMKFSMYHERGQDHGMAMVWSWS